MNRKLAFDGHRKPVRLPCVIDEKQRDYLVRRSLRYIHRRQSQIHSRHVLRMYWCKKCSCHVCAYRNYNWWLIDWTSLTMIKQICTHVDMSDVKYVHKIHLHMYTLVYVYMCAINLTMNAIKVMKCCHSIGTIAASVARCSFAVLGRFMTCTPHAFMTKRQTCVD
jgi:hypothetical protein